MKSIQIISQDLFDKVRSRFANLEMGDETGAVTIDPAEARFFDFDFVNEGHNLGRVSISVNDLGSLKVYYSQGITENQDDPAKRLWYNFLREMRLFAMRRLLRFDTRDIAKTNLDKNDFQYLASKGPKEEPSMNMNESKWNNKSSTKTSRAVRGSTEVVLRHHHKVDEMYPGARSQKKNIKAIFIQNKDGERYKYPFIHPAGAFAMAQHVDHGGVPHDPAGKAIINMSEQIAQLQEFQRKIQHTQLHDDASGITERALGRMNELKARIDSLGKRHHYESWMAEFAGQDNNEAISELDDVTMEDYKSKFTETNFKEELASFFPLIHSIMRETNSLNLEDFVGEGTECSVCHKAPCECEVKVKESVDEFAQFKEWAEATELGTQQPLTSDQITFLQQAIKKQEESGEQLQLGPHGATAWDFFSQAINPGNDIGPEFSNSLKQKFEVAAQEFPDTDAMEVFQSWAGKDNEYPELLTALGMSGSAGQKPEQQPEQPTAENGDMSMGPGTTETHDPKEMTKMIAEKVKSFYNAANEEVGPFRGHEGILIDVEKECAGKFGEAAGQQARQMAEAFMNKLTKEWEERHGKSAEVGAVDDSGLARLKELLGNIKTKVEGIGDQGDTYSNNIMSSEDGPDKSKIPAHLRKAKGEEPLSLDDLEKERTKSPTNIDHLRRLNKEINAREAAENGPDKSKIPAHLRKAKGEEPLSLADLEKERTKSPTNIDHLRRLNKEINARESTEMESILKLAGLKK